MADLWEKARQGKTSARWGLRVALMAFLAGLIAVAPAYARLRERVLTFRGLALEKIVVEGADRLLQADVVAISGLAAGTSLLDVDPARVARRIERNPWIRTADVRRHWPREIRIRIVERRPVALLLVSQDLYVLDSEGATFKRADPEDELDLPVVTGVGEDRLTNDLESGRAVLTEAAGLLARLEETSFGRGVSELHRDDGGGYSVVTRSGVVLDLGEPGSEPAAISVLESAMPGIRARLGEPAAVAVMGDGSLAVRRARKALGPADDGPGGGKR